MVMRFTCRRWGDCIHEVVKGMPREVRGKRVVSGRILFKSDTYISLVFSTVESVKYNICGRQLMVRKYIPRR
jgi:hypothetical protein